MGAAVADERSRRDPLHLGDARLPGQRREEPYPGFAAAGVRCQRLPRGPDAVGADPDAGHGEAGLGHHEQRGRAGGVRGGRGKGLVHAREERPVAVELAPRVRMVRGVLDVGEVGGGAGQAQAGPAPEPREVALQLLLEDPLAVGSGFQLQMAAGGTAAGPAEPVELVDRGRVVDGEVDVQIERVGEASARDVAEEQRRSAPALRTQHGGLLELGDAEPVDPQLRGKPGQQAQAVPVRVRLDHEQQGGPGGEQRAKGGEIGSERRDVDLAPGEKPVARVVHDRRL